LPPTPPSERQVPTPLRPAAYFPADNTPRGEDEMTEVTARPSDALRYHTATPRPGLANPYDDLVNVLGRSGGRPSGSVATAARQTMPARGFARR